jgi:hypothetical protein
MKFTLNELNSAKTLLRSAHMSVAAVASIFFNAGAIEPAARLRSIMDQLAADIGHLDKLIGAQPGGG